MHRVALVLGIFLLSTIGNVWAQETTLTVRAKANDAKYIGTAMAGVQVSVTHAFTHELLAQGLITGGTGSTKDLMENPIVRGQRLSTEGGAAFTTVLDIDAPTQLNIRLHGPLASGKTSVDASQSVWMLPGKDIGGDGIVFNLYGFVLVPLSPHANTQVEVGEVVNLSTYVTMLCGCPITDGGMWDANSYQVEAAIWDEEKLVETVTMQLGSENGIFNATYVPQHRGNYRIVFTAADIQTNNYGVAYSGIAVK
ncbi:MAG: hypothetical protein RBR43_05975 [Desulfuromonadaceae bacterium]|nr:hypothetical protein [Desulfuromonadaceae bacterium]